MSLAARIDRLERAISALHLATRVLVQFGDADRDPDLADLRIVPPPEHAKDVEDDIAPTFERLNLTVRDHRDHVVAFLGADPEALRAQAAALVAALATQKLLRVVGQLGGDDQERSVVTVDRDRAATLGVTASEIATTLRILAPGGMEVSTVFDRQKEHRVMLAVEGQLRELIDQVMVRSTTGGLVPLSAVAKVTETREPTVIFHEGQVRWIGVRVAGSLDVLQDVLATLPVPQGVRRDVREPD
jgi:multidrug efflux pump subunit AcrB